jgi:NAD-dependent dihydropyrimidine dehydrogenase PreA subunit
MADETVTQEKGKKPEEIRKEAEEKACPVQRILYYIDEFIAGPMCGKCYPCALGTQEAKVRLIRISQHLDDVTASDIDALKRIGLQMTEGSFCKKGKDTGRFITETLAGSSEEFTLHLSGTCPQKECLRLVEYVINPDLCIMCGKCLEACKYDAIAGERREPGFSGYLPFEIRQKRCTRCGECIKVCPEEAIEVITYEIEELVDSSKHLK